MFSRSTPILLVIAGIVLFFFYVEPQYEKVQAKRDMQREFESALEEANDLASVRSSALEIYNSYNESEKQRLRVMVPSEVDHPRVFNTIERIGGAHGVFLTSVTVKDSDTTSRSRRRSSEEEGAISDVTPITLGFSAESSYQGFLPFLQDIEQNLQLMDPMVVEVRSSGDEQSLYTFTVTLQTYSL